MTVLAQASYTFTQGEVATFCTIFVLIMGAFGYFIRSESKEKAEKVVEPIKQDLEVLKRDSMRWESKFTIIDIKHNSYEENFERLQNSIEKMHNKIEVFCSTVSNQISSQNEILKTILNKIDKD